jgi:hypothetical protein
MKQLVVLVLLLSASAFSYPIDSDVETLSGDYATRAGIGAKRREQVQDCLRELNSHPSIWTNIMEMGFCGTNFGAGLTLLGQNPVTISNVTAFGAGCFFTNNTGGRITVDFQDADLRTNTVFVVTRPKGGGLANSTQKCVAGMFFGTNFGEMLTIDAYAVGQMRARGSNSFSPAAYTWLSDARPNYFALRDWRRRTIGCSFAGQTVQGFIDGIPAVMNTNQVPPEFVQTNHLNMLCIGNTAAGSDAYDGEVSVWLVLKTALTTNSLADAQCINRAFLYLEDETVVTYVIGDSQGIPSAQENDADPNGSTYPTNGWPSIVMNELGGGRLWFNDATSGAIFSDWAFVGGAGFVLMTNRVNAILPAKKLRVACDMGMNDYRLGISAEAQKAAVLELLQRLQAWGCDVVMTTQNSPGTNNFLIVPTPAQDAVRSAVNSYIRTLPLVTVLDKDLLITADEMGNTNIGGITRDSVHLRRAGNVRVAQECVRVCALNARPSLTISWSYAANLPSESFLLHHSTNLSAWELSAVLPVSCRSLSLWREPGGGDTSSGFV